MMPIKNLRYIVTAAIVGLSAFALSARLDFSGLPEPAFKADAERASGLEAVYVLPMANGVTVSYTATSSQVSWNRYGTPGQPMTEIEGVTRNGNVYTVTLQEGDTGFVISDGTEQHYYWITDYSQHELRVAGLSVSPESACDRVFLDIDGTGDAIHYFSVSGRGFELSRDIKLGWQTLEYDKEQKQWIQTPATETLPSLHAVTGVEAPLCDTDFTLAGDRFLEFWGRGISVSSQLYTAVAVRAETEAIQESRDNSNEKNNGTDGLGGSAPCVITFTAVPTDAAVFREWQFARTEEFEDIDRRFNQDELTHTFDEQATLYVRYQCSDAAGQCFYNSPVYTVNIGASVLECPNAFSPNGDGKNDEWKVSYQSIVSFECHIFNRWGTKLCSFTNPADGWDGKYKGKVVPTGVYFYVIKAVGADGRKYNLSGDINILHRSRNTGTNTAPPGSEE